MDPEVEQLLDLGVQKKREGKYGEAIRLYMTAIDTESRKSISYYSLAKTLYLSKGKELAVLDYLRSTHLELREYWRKIRTNDPNLHQVEMFMRPISGDLHISYDQIHPAAKYLLLDINTTKHLGHALLDFEWRKDFHSKAVDLQIKKMIRRYYIKLPMHISKYRRGLAGKSVFSYDQDIDNQLYIPIARDFLLKKISWQQLETSEDVRDIFKF